MENEQIIKSLKLYVSLMELHEENPFKVKSIQNAVFSLEKIDTPLKTLQAGEIEKLEGIGKSVSAKIADLITKGSFDELDELAGKTPLGIISMLDIKGLGPKKIRTIWKELDIAGPDELLKACEENRISQLKGFGEKTQEAIRQVLVFANKQRGLFLYAELEATAERIETDLKSILPGTAISLSGEIRRRMEVISLIQFVAGTDEPASALSALREIPYLEKDHALSSPFIWRGAEKRSSVQVEIRFYSHEEFHKKVFLHSLNPRHLTLKNNEGIVIGDYLRKNAFVSEETFYKELGMQYIAPETREGMSEVAKARQYSLPTLLETKDLKGILHNHSTYSDGIHTLEQMAIHCQQLGYEYLGISDHSKSAFYANGLQENRIMEQHAEIDQLNERLFPFKIFKGIESDILSDGALDYPDRVLASFDFIVASIHSNLKMTQEKATRRLLTAIENPYTTMLGHPTGRLLLRREGYPIDHKAIIDACVSHNVVIEINANPYRLDMDWRHVLYAIEKGAWISINPDAHSMAEYDNMKYGVLVGRKAGLGAGQTFNALSVEQVAAHFGIKKAAAKSLS